MLVSSWPFSSAPFCPVWGRISAFLSGRKKKTKQLWAKTCFNEAQTLFILWLNPNFACFHQTHSPMFMSKVKWGRVKKLDYRSFFFLSRSTTQTNETIVMSTLMYLYQRHPLVRPFEEGFVERFWTVSILPEADSCVDLLKQLWSLNSYSDSRQRLFINLYTAHFSRLTSDWRNKEVTSVRAFKTEVNYCHLKTACIFDCSSL